MKNQKFKLHGKYFEFELEVSNYGFTLWTKKESGRGKNQFWVIDASTLCDDGTFVIGKENDGYGFTVEVDNNEYEDRHYNLMLVRNNETPQIPLDVDKS